MVVDGQVAEFGAFKEPFREVNLLDVELELNGRRAPRALREMRLKEWEHFGIISEEYYFGMVIFDAKFMGTSFFYAYNRKTGEFIEHERTSMGGPLRVARELWHGECYYRHFGYIMEFENRLDSGMHRLRAQIREKRGKPSVEAEVFVLEDLERYQPLVQVSPIAKNRPLYTHKTACPVEGRIVLGGREVLLDPERDVALMDVIGFGLTAWRRVMPELISLRVQASPHAWGIPLKTLYAAQIAAGLGNVITVEGVPGSTGGADTSGYSLIDGRISVPDGPGFGIPLTT